MACQGRPESSRHDDLVENGAFERIGLSALRGLKRAKRAMRHGALFSTKSSDRDDSLGYIHLLEPIYKVYDIFSGECFYYLSNLIKSYFAARGTLSH